MLLCRSLNEQNCGVGTKGDNVQQAAEVLQHLKIHGKMCCGRQAIVCGERKSLKRQNTPKDVSSTCCIYAMAVIVKMRL